MLLFVVVLVNILGVVVIISLRFQLGLINPTTEIAWFEIGSLGGRESSLWLSIVSHGVLSGVKFGSDLGITLVHQVFVHESSVVTGITWNVLLANHVGWSTDPVDRVLASITIDVGVDAL